MNRSSRTITIIFSIMLVTTLIGCSKSKQTPVNTNPPKDTVTVKQPQQQEQQNQQEEAQKPEQKPHSPKLQFNKALGIEAQKITNENPDIVVNKLLVDDVPFYEIYKKDNSVKPLIIMIHFATGSKESVVWNALDFAYKGFYCVVPDAYAHGERVNNPAIRMTQIEVFTSDECNSLIDFYSSNKKVDISKLGIIGYSLGGSSAYHYAAYGKYKPKAIASYGSTPYWEQLVDIGGIPMMTYSVVSGNGQTTDSQDTVNKYLINNSPFKNYANMKNMTVVMFNGEKDTVIPPEGAKKLYDALKSLGSKNVHLILSKEGDHGEATSENYLKTANELFLKALK
ncbi:MAG: alpha/beta hydrolase family protein [Clostridium sp.]|uniref:alpha/beta hydrolase family protein n=1 Tax=Clostridium sp. TaxID=1506 RepID=UPI003D6D2502